MKGKGNMAPLNCSYEHWQVHPGLGETRATDIHKTNNLGTQIRKTAALRCVNFVGGLRTSRAFWLFPICLIWIDHSVQQLFERAFCHKSLPRCLLVCWIEANPWVLLNGTQLRRSCEDLSFILALYFTIFDSIHPDLGVDRFTKLKENPDDDYLMHSIQWRNWHDLNIRAFYHRVSMSR